MYISNCYNFEKLKFKAESFSFIFNTYTDYYYDETIIRTATTYENPLL